MKTLNDLLKQETISKQELNNLGLDITEIDLKTRNLLLSKLAKDEVKKAKKSEFIYKESLNLFNKLGNTNEFKSLNKKIRTKKRNQRNKLLNVINSIKDKQQIETFVKFYKNEYCVNDFSKESIFGSSTNLSTQLQYFPKFEIVKQFVTKK